MCIHAAKAPGAVRSVGRHLLGPGRSPQPPLGRDHTHLGDPQSETTSLCAVVIILVGVVSPPLFHSQHQHVREMRGARPSTSPVQATSAHPSAEYNELLLQSSVASPYPCFTSQNSVICSHGIALNGDGFLSRHFLIMYIKSSFKSIKFLKKKVHLYISFRFFFWQHYTTMFVGYWCVI